MKRIISLLVVMVGLTISANAQKAVMQPVAVGDTIITSGSTDTVFHYVDATAGYSAMTIHINGTKLSGTTALKAYLATSGDNGASYVVTDSSVAFTDVAVIQFSKTPPAFSRYQIQVHQPTSAASTQSVKLRFWVTLKKYDR